MKIENISTSNWENAIRGMRNPYDSWNKSDSSFGILDESRYEETKNYMNIQKIKQDNEFIEYVALGPEDIDLAQRLIKGGPVHSKFLRQIFISMDITAPLYWQISFCQ